MSNLSLTVDHSQSQDSAGAGSRYPVKELTNRLARFLLQRYQHLDQDKAFDTSSIQTQQPVRPSQRKRKQL